MSGFRRTLTVIVCGVPAAAGLYAVAKVVPTGTTARPAAATALPRCPYLFGHGGYSASNDQILGLNSVKAVDAQKSKSADGVEGDLRFTRDGTKAVMWHNITTNGLTGRSAVVRNSTWTSLQPRRITRGPYKGERVYTFREWLLELKKQHLQGLVELKFMPQNTSAWHELATPLRSTGMASRVILYSTGADDHNGKQIVNAVRAKIKAGVLPKVRTQYSPATTKNDVHGVGWQTALKAGYYGLFVDSGLRSTATGWTRDDSQSAVGFRRWAVGRCARPSA
ncbi:glycerophosphodiester phosphodiesterase [Actinoallomurus rhizosphaericola]|uniref:glycerophosphodiester phosphodiesterase n=1 Tax=Actinoallomurus rhizosphaericola TaxID=2952536 RepID=UPI0020916EA9|nr:glycerophosphodiester phosphodiesterase family protein [Actinoallomurus rhizosphaericola]MCO5993999.1 hypothetical protein [Actinoallomurus rhizosphaericola]